MKIFKKNINLYLIRLVTLLLFMFLSVSSIANAIELTSTNFIIKDPVVGTGSGFGTSTNFQSLSSMHTSLSDTGSSTSFTGRYGFLYYPYVNSGTLTATPNVSDADLSWTTSVAELGWIISGYSTGIASVSGGPYTFTDVGNVTSYSYEDLAPGEYCFVVETWDMFDETIAISNEECLTIDPVITFSISANNISFGNLSVSSPRYANTGGGSNTDVVAHTLSAGSNASSGYIITYQGQTLTSGANTIDVASSVSGDGTQGVEQFGLSLETDGSATIVGGYQQSGPTRSFVANTTTAVANTSGLTALENFGVHYLANISTGTQAGTYTTEVTYIMTGTF